LAAVRAQRLNQAYRQAPWRKATQVGVLFIILAVLGASILWIMLTVTVQAASAGMAIQDLETQQETLQREIASARTDIAIYTSATNMASRAAELGFRQASPDEITYMVITGYTGRHTNLTTPPPVAESEPLLIKPSYTQSLSEWLFEGLTRYSEQNGGLAP
jgi:cell division protein FtsB